MSEDVVGLRYVSEGLDKTLRELQQYNKAVERAGGGEKQLAQAQKNATQTTQRKTQTTNTAKQAEKAYFAAQRRRIQMMNASRTLEERQRRQTVQANREIARIEAQKKARFDANAAAAQRYYNQLLGVRTVNQNAAQSARVLERELAKQERAATRAATSSQRLAVAQSQTTTAAMALRGQMLATANSIAILDGPLGGIASRFSAFGVLVGRTGLLMGGFLVTLAALGTVLGRATQRFIEAERAMLRLQGVLTATQGAAGLAASEIEGLAQRVASSTLASVAETREAATALLTFRSVTGDVFGEVLMLAQDMAELGFGTVRSEAVKLAKAIEDPRQSLTSLSRSGVTFTLQQRQVIQSLVETGREAEATARILGIVTSQVGGAGTRAAEGFAGSIDSIAQAIGNLSEQVGAGVLDVNLTPLLPLIDERFAFTLGDFIGRLGQQAAEFNRQFATASPAERLREIGDELERLQAIPAATGWLRFTNVDASIQERINDLLREQVKVESELRQAREDAENARRDRQRAAVADLASELEQRRDLLGLTEREVSVREALGKLGLRGAFPAGSAQAEMQAQAIAIAENLFDTRKQRDFLRGMESTLDSLRAQNTESEIMLRYMGDTTNEAQARATQEILLNRLLENGVDAGSRLFKGFEAVTEETVRLAREADSIQAGIDAAANAATTLAFEMSAAAQEALNFVSNLGGGAGLNAASARVQGLRAELTARQAGAGDVAAAGVRARAEAMSRPETQLALQGPEILVASTRRSIDEAVATAEENARARQIQTEIRDLNRPARGGGGGGGRAQEAQNLETIVQRLQQQVSRERELLMLNSEQRAERETYFELLDALDSAGVSYSDRRVQQIAREIAAEKERVKILEEQNRIADTVAEGFSSMFTDAITGAESLNDSLRKLLGSLSQLFFNKAFMQILEGPLGGLIGAGGSLTGSPRSNAAGTNSFMGGLTRINERGGEIAVLPSGSKVIPNSLSQGMTGGGTSIVINNNTGAPVQEQRTTGPDGRELVEVTVGEAITKGRYDKQLGGRYGNTPQRIKR